MNTANTAPDGRRAGLRVLLVEDHAGSAARLAVLLRGFGHEVAVAHDGPAALEAARAGRPDVVLLDIGLPGGMDGHEVARRIKAWEAPRRPLLVAVTGLGAEEDRLRSEAAGIDLHLVKPADPDGLRALLERFRSILTPPGGAGPPPAG